ncbi:MAG: hypothetical protein Q9181_003130 [Wetmoreana brouardii]
MASMSTSFLPTIKCSDCNIEIEISAMGDHVCSKTPASSSSMPRLWDASMKPSSIPATVTGKRPFKMPPARIDPLFASEYR